MAVSSSRSTDRSTESTPSESREPLVVVQLLDEGPEIPVPEGMTRAEWATERIRWQNPRIRALLGCIRLLGGVQESNYAILHCSPDRLLEIFSKVRQVSVLIRTEVAPLLAHPSPVSALEDARQRIEVALDFLSRTVLVELNESPSRSQAPHEITPVDMLALRKLLCVSIGKLNAFLQDSFGELLANDPRSSRNADYFLSKRFPQDLEEAEWLQSTVMGLYEYLQAFDLRRKRLFTPLITEIRHDLTLPTDNRWENAETLLGIVLEVLTPKLKEVLALRGIRFYEMEILDRYAIDIPTHCQLLKEIYLTGRRATREMKAHSGPHRREREQSVEHLMICHEIFSRRMVELMEQIDQELRDLVAFVPIWLDSIDKRRALLLRRGTDTDPTPPPTSKDTAPIPT